MAGIRLHTFRGILRNYVLEAIQTRTVSNFGTFYYMFIVNVGLYNCTKNLNLPELKFIRNYTKNIHSFWKTLKLCNPFAQKVYLS